MSWMHEAIDKRQTDCDRGVAHALLDHEPRAVGQWWRWCHTEDADQEEKYLMFDPMTVAIGNALEEAGLNPDDLTGLRARVIWAAIAKAYLTTHQKLYRLMDETGRLGPSPYESQLASEGSRP